jgi:O-antigen ligase
MAPRLALALLLFAALAITLWPSETLFAAVAFAVAGAACLAARKLGLTRAATTAYAVAALVAVVGLALWPTFLLVVTLVAATTVLAFVRPLYGFVAALLLFSAEGLVKAALSAGSTPFDVDATALGAVLLDLALTAAIVAVLLESRDAHGRRGWSAIGRAARIGIALLAAWLALSVVQIPQSGDVVAGLAGFRVTQAYVLVAVAGALLAVATRGRKLAELLLGVCTVVAAYAALRVATGPSAIERAYVLARPGDVKAYGDVFRTVGSFSGAVGLASFLVPAAVFAFALALCSPRNRVAPALAAVLAFVGIVGTQTRGAVVAVAAGTVIAAALFVLAARPSRRAVLLVFAAVVIALAGVAGATAVAMGVSAATSKRAQAFVHPLRDESIRLRLRTLERSVKEVEKHPFGTGLGTVGRASELRGKPVTTDNSYVKVLREQGYLGGVLFAAGIVVVLGALGARLRRAPGNATLEIAAFAAAVSFFVLALFGEYVEQPGKVLAWALLGVAVGAVAAAHEQERAQ